MRQHPLPTGLGLFLLCALLYLWGLGDVPFYTKGEPREATVVWEIYTTGDWVLPLRNGHIIPSKPPLFHWLGTLVSFAWGAVNELTIRLPSAGLAILGVLLTYGTGVALWGVEAGLVAAVVLATSFEWSRAATTARVDMTLTVCMVTAFVFFLFLYRRQKVGWGNAIVFYLLLGLATLAKGPVGVVLPGLTIILFLTFRRDLKFLRHLHMVTGGVLVALIAGSWYGLALWKGGQDFFIKQILKENVLRFFTSDAGHEHPFYYFVPNLFLGMAPWSFFFPPLAVFLYQRRRTWAKDGFLYLLVWSATILFFYSVAKSKRSVYILPLYPAMALLLGAWWQELRQGSTTLPATFFWLMRGSGYLCLILLGVTIASVFLQIFGYDPLALIRSFLHPKDQSNLPLFTGIVVAHLGAFLLWGIVVGLSAILLILGLQRRYWGWVFASLATFTVSLSLLVNTVFQPTVAATRTYRPFMERVVTSVGDAPLFFYQTFDNGALYYAKRHVPFYDPTLLQPGAPYFLLMRQEEWEKISSRNTTDLLAVDVSEGTGPKDRHHLVLVQAPHGAVVPSIPVENSSPAVEEDTAEEDTL